MTVSRLRRALARLKRRTRPVDPEVATAHCRRWAELPEHVRTSSRLLGRKFIGCEGTHGVFPACNGVVVALVYGALA